MASRARRCWPALALVLASASCSASCSATSRPPAPVEPISQPERTAAEARDLRTLVRDVAAARICPSVRGRYVGLPGASGDAVEGRILVDRCEARITGEETLALDLAGRGFRWVSRDLGAGLALDQYVRLAVHVDLEATVDAAYAKEDHVLTLWLTPTRPVKAEVDALGEIRVRSEGTFGDIVGGALSTFSRSPSERAASALERKATEQFERRLAEGYTVAIDLCFPQAYETVGALKQGELPDKPFPDRRFLGDQRVHVFPGGLDLAGPFHDAKELRVRVDVDPGAPVRARLVCEADAAALARAFVEGRTLPSVDALADEVVDGRVSKTLALDAPPCPVVLWTTPTQSNEVGFRFLAFDASADPSPLAPCDR